MRLQSPAGLTITALTAGDIPAALALTTELGWNQTAEDLGRFLRLAPNGAFKLVVGGQLAGTAVAFVFDEVCWIGMVIVREAYRGEGHGKMLMERCLDHASGRRCTLVQLDATSLGVSLYARLGFRPDYLVGTCSGRIVPPEGEAAVGEPSEGQPAVGKPANAGRSPGLVLAPVRLEDLAEMVALEGQAVGANREALLRELVGNPAGERPVPERGVRRVSEAGGQTSGKAACPGRGMVCRGPAGDLQGFLLYRPGHHAVQVGPLIARDDAAAGQVLRGTLRKLCGSVPECQVTLAVPLYNQGMLAELRRWGLPVTPRLTRMFRGRKRLQAQEDMIYALGGPEKG
ncbi:MAG: GNAT family N-acetyltransferase [Spirochaetales bacterium]|nr:GNAT family N-acetyltransferase [Spirochaetales bacterium]